MSRIGPNEHPASTIPATPEAFAAAIVNQLSAQVVRSFEGRFQAQEERFNQFASSNTLFQNSVLTLLGAGDAQPVAAAPPPAPAAGTGQTRAPAVPRPDKVSKTQMTRVMHRVLTNGCDIKHFKEATLGLTEEELEERIRTKPDKPWEPYFLRPMSHPSNVFWVGGALDAIMEDPKALKYVEDGTIKREFWTRECMEKHILGPMWNNVKKEVKARVDEEAAARSKVNHSKTNRVGRNKRLQKARLKLAVGSGKHPKFQYKHNDEMRHVPPELMVEEAMSDVVDEYDSDSLPNEVTRDEYRKDRRKFSYEGRAPFFRRKEPWNTIFSGMDTITVQKTKGFGIEARYYAGEVCRGQRNNLEPEMASEIPTSRLHRCHLSKEWYDRLSEAQKTLLKPSPAGWEVDEERLTIGASS